MPETSHATKPVHQLDVDQQVPAAVAVERLPRSLVWPAVGCFVLVTFAAAAGLVMLQAALQLDLVVIEIVQFAPVIGVLAVLIMRAVSRRDVGELPRTGLGRGGWSRLLVALLAPLLIMGGAVIGWVATGHIPDLVTPSSLTAGFGLIVLAQFVGACAEEIGWRGYLQPTLQGRWGLVPAAIVVGLVWGCWHIQIFSAGPAYAGAFLLSTIAMSILMAVFVERMSRGRTLIAGTFHWSINIAMLLTLPEESGNTMAMLWIAIGCSAGAAVSLLVRQRISATRQSVHDTPSWLAAKTGSHSTSAM